MKLTTQQAIKKFRDAHRMASNILAGAHAGLPDETHVHHLATALFTHNIEDANAPTGPRGVDRGSPDRKGDALLSDAYDEDEQKSDGSY